MLAEFNHSIDVIQTIMADDYGKYVVLIIMVFVAMGVDVLLGFLQAVYNGNVMSLKMSKGFLKKGGILAVLVLVFFITVALPETFQPYILTSVFVLEIGNELVSIVENLSKMDIGTEFLEPILKLLHSHSKEDDNNVWL